MTLFMTDLLKQREHAESDHVLSQVVAHLQDESGGHVTQHRLVHVAHLQPERFLHGCHGNNTAWQQLLYHTITLHLMCDRID